MSDDPRAITNDLWHKHTGMHDGACHCGAPLDTSNGASWTETAEAYRRHLWTELAALTDRGTPTEEYPTFLGIPAPSPEATRCTGDFDCPTATHTHGCYADQDGASCDDPGDHVTSPSPEARAEAAEAERDAAQGPHGGGRHMSQAEWSDWSNDLALLVPEEYDDDVAQEAIIERALGGLVSRLAAAEAELALLRALNGEEREDRQTSLRANDECAHAFYEVHDGHHSDGWRCSRCNAYWSFAPWNIQSTYSPKEVSTVPKT